ncbi:protein LOW PSII ACCUMULATION 3, chloroplastic isoform X1 [Benincasa hispida]|uniref:protein LOW PSII ACCUMULATION 3, chloroplastic isoform X1 n=1 Tax=Benincasa hispida TaxID=102211 RepID=UPI001900AF95|nr:protein LOW PSII ACCUMULATION 3, chloroplastic isoform X1 [Benincasa hispida]
MHFSNANFASSSAIPTAILPLPSPNLACFRISHRKTHRSFLFSSLFEFKARRNLRVSANSSNRQSSNASTDLDVPFPRDYSDLLNQAKKATEAALRDNKQLMEIEFPTAGLESVPGDGEGGNEMTESMQLIRQFCDCFIDPLKATRTRVFFPEANEVKFARNTAFEGVSFKLDYLTKPSFFEDFGFVEKVKMADRVKPEDELFLVAYPYFNVNEMLVVEELYKEAVQNTTRKLIIFNGELDRIRSGCILLSTFLLFNEERVKDYPPFFYPKLAALMKTLFPKMETVYYIHNFKGQKGGVLFRCYPGPWKVLRKVRNKFVCVHQQEDMPSLKEVALNILPSS